MSFEKFELGVNEHGVHFRNPETGAIGTFKYANYAKLEIALCFESASEAHIEELKELINADFDYKGLKLQDKEFKSIELQKCYIAENQQFFELDGFAGDGITLIYKPTKQIFGVDKFLQGAPRLCFGLGNFYDCEQATKDFFEICSKEVTEIVAGTYLAKTYIQRRDSIEKVEKQLLNSLISGVKHATSKQGGTVEYYQQSIDCKIIIKSNFSPIVVKRTSRKHWKTELQEENQISGLIYAIELVKKAADISSDLPEINKLIYNQKYNGKKVSISITPKNVDTVLKESLRSKQINPKV